MSQINQNFGIKWQKSLKLFLEPKMSMQRFSAQQDEKPSCQVYMVMKLLEK